MALLIDKDELLAELLRLVEVDLDAITEGQQASQAGATHAENKAEGDKDMRSTESSYLARGLAKRVLELRTAVSRLSNLKNRVFGEESIVAMSALLEVEDEDEDCALYYIAPSGGGIVVELDGAKISVITPTSPLARAMIGRHLDDEVELQTPQGPKILTVTKLS
jgi:transcription elongation GreA/GreB family factor